MNKRMAFIVILVTTVLLYDLVFHTTCFFPEQCYPVCMVHLVASVLYSHVIMAAFAKAFPNYCKDTKWTHKSSFSQTFLKMLYK